MPTDEQLSAIMPTLPQAKRAAFLPALQQAIDEFGIAAPAREAAFLAQLAHESGQLRFMEEIWGPTDAQRRYEPVTSLSARLGNTEAGDGKRFKGRGPIQLTGRANYTVFGQALGVDLIADPARAASPDVAFRIAALFWQRKGLNELADLMTEAAFKEITRRINGGFNGLADRQRFYKTALEVLQAVGHAGTPTPPPPPATRGFGARPTDLPAGDLLEVAFQRGAEAIREAESALRARAVKRGRAKAAKKTTAKKTSARRASARKPVAGKAVKRSVAKARSKKAPAKTAKKTVGRRAKRVATSPAKKTSRPKARKR
jgi:predicted chitinase